jgi:hypothetical protein
MDSHAFANLSQDPTQEYFSDGVTKDSITGLSKVSGLFVIARTSVFTYKGKPERVRRYDREVRVEERVGPPCACVTRHDPTAGCSTPPGPVERGGVDRGGRACRSDGVEPP